MYLLLRASNDDLAANRLQDEIIGTYLFRVLRDEWGEDFDSFMSKKVIVIPGDVSLENLGLKDEDLKNEMLKEIEVLVNFAASTKFDERFDISMGVNTTGALNVLNFAKSCHEINVLLHISTAYVSGEIADGEAVKEKPFEMTQSLKKNSKLDIHVEMNLLEKKLDELRAKNASEITIKYAMKDYGLERANLYGWPNTYVFTKAMGEMLLVHYKDNVPLIIIRPTMVTSTYKDPFPGWIEGIRTVDSVICGYGQGKLACFLGHPKTILDMIPADMVINCVITAIVAHSNQVSKNFIYHVASSSRNPLRISDVINITFHYFTKSPLKSKNGTPIIVSKMQLLTSMAAFQSYMKNRYVLPLKVLNVVNEVFCHFFQDVYDDNFNKIQKVIGLGKIFDDTNTENLRRETKRHLNKEAVGLGFDPYSIDWTDYMMNTHIPGLTKYALMK
ncbi:fatty acyl-CoA reductase 1-like isoform X2 [Lotus japonicus]|uniref:fatty acyl-CoA reductase 1-like isoform X2 n=1 Tax=Lotus japonicus TaxID=34305 RepID=UPI00258E6EA7|nr:fatty acyl-CoA reductase 1-like isoform X2 [Lotus japonicus]